VEWSKELDVVRGLFREYREWLAEHRDTSPSGRATATQGLALIDRLISELPGAYGPPRGEVILAFADGSIAACGALRELEPSVGEIKRVYVRADHRGPGFGPRLTQALLDRARELHYERVRVDTLGSMIAAIQFYQDLGFRRIPSFWPHPAPGTLFFEYRMPRSRSGARAATPRTRKVSSHRAAAPRGQGIPRGRGPSGSL